MPAVGLAIEDRVVIRPLAEQHAVVAERLVDEVLGSRLQVRLGEVVDVLALPGMGAWDDERLVGIATYSAEADSAEIAALGVLPAHRRCGIASGLLDATLAAFSSSGIARTWLVTTNDNLPALGLYQRHGFRLVALHPGAVDRARLVKPSIPALGHLGIPMRDELVLERRLPGAGDHSP